MSIEALGILGTMIAGVISIAMYIIASDMEQR